MSNKITGDEQVTGFAISGDDKAGWHPETVFGMTLRQKALLDFMCALVKPGTGNFPDRIANDAEQLTTAYITQLNKQP